LKAIREPELGQRQNKGGSRNPMIVQNGGVRKFMSYTNGSALLELAQNFTALWRLFEIREHV
jgi:hypothetical protein